MVVLGRLSPEKRLAPPAGQHLKFHGQKAWDQGGDVLNPYTGAATLALFLQAYSSRIPWIQSSNRHTSFCSICFTLHFTDTVFLIS